MIGIVYHTFLINDWKSLVLEQLNRLKKSGLYDEADIIWVTVNLNGLSENEFKEHVSEYEKLNIEYHINNGAEYPGIKKVRDLCEQHDDMKILYFHTKGVNNKYLKNNSHEISEEKVKNIKLWRECLEYFLIDNWKDCLIKLNEYDNVGVTCNGGWFWGNFWWSQTKHIIKTREVGYWSRWDYEAWMNDYVEGPIKNFEYYKFVYNPYICPLYEEWYKTPELFKNSKIHIIKAEYGTAPFEIDEGYNGTPLDVKVDVTDIVKNKVISDDNDKIDIGVVNEFFGEDPIPNYRKFVFIWFYLNDKKDKIYKIGTHEGSHLIFKF